MTCIYSNDCPNFNTSKCNNICPYFIVTHGWRGTGGYWSVRNVPKKYSHLFVDELPKGKAFEVVKKYIKKLPDVVDGGAGLYLYSSPTKDNPFGTGTGKTTSAITILNEFTKLQCKRITKREIAVRHNPSIFVKGSDFQNKYNSQFRGTKDMQEIASISYYNYKELMKNVKLLVLDDIAVRTGTEAFITEIYEIVDHRATEGLATIYTSNISLKKLADFYDERIVSRIDGTTHQIPFTGIDHRKKVL